jgi:hypothetical protein
MSLFSLDWFKSKKKVEPKTEKEISVSFPVSVEPVEYTVTITAKPYKSVKMVGDVLTVVLPDGEIITKSSATTNDFEKVAEAKNVEDIVKIVTIPEVLAQKIKDQTEAERITTLQEGIKLLAQLDDFTIEDNVVYMTGTPRSVPELLVNEFLEIVEKYSILSSSVTINEYVAKDVNYQSLKNFFLWACLNPRAEVTNDLYDFLKRNSFRITKQGFFAALRNVVTVNEYHTKINKDDKDGTTEGDRALVDFVSNAYNKVKAVWKKKPANFIVHKGVDGYFMMGVPKAPYDATNDVSYVGNLQDLYKVEMPTMKGNRFTDDYTKTFDIRVGKVVSMPMNECSWSTADCAHAGLHFTADQIHYVGCGDTSMLVLINPMKVVGIGTSKGRCYEYLPIMTVPREEATKLLHDLDFDTLELDEDYVIHELESLAEKAKDGFVAETTKHHFNLPAMSTNEIHNIVKSLSKMKDAISKRVSVIE